LFTLPFWCFGGKALGEYAFTFLSRLLTYNDALKRPFWKLQQYGYSYYISKSLAQFWKLVTIHTCSIMFFKISLNFLYLVPFLICSFQWQPRTQVRFSFILIAFGSEWHIIRNTYSRCCSTIYSNLIWKVIESVCDEM
jgi:hypothetical protein